MNQLLLHLKPWAPFIASVLGFFFALVIAVRYKLPALTERLEAVEESDRSKTTNKDLGQALDGFKAICQFNQATCKIEHERSWSAMRKELDDKLSGLHKEINDLAQTTAKLVAKVEILLKDRDKNRKEG